MARATGRAACPGCATRQRRSEPATSEPAVWYDTLARDWVLRLPLSGTTAGALLPLEIGWFDADFSSVYRAAADILFASEDLDDTVEASSSEAG
jgi:hypothetical protein